MQKSQDIFFLKKKKAIKFFGSGEKKNSAKIGNRKLYQSFGFLGKVFLGTVF